MSDLPPASPKSSNISQKLTVYVEEKCAFLMYESWFSIDPGGVRIQFREYFEILKKVVKIWT